MGKEQKHPLRALTPQEEQEFQRVTKATSERVDVVKRARALLAGYDRESASARRASPGSRALALCAYEAIHQQALIEMQLPDFRATWPLVTAWGMKPENQQEGESSDQRRP